MEDIPLGQGSPYTFIVEAMDDGTGEWAEVERRVAYGRFARRHVSLHLQDQYHDSVDMARMRVLDRKNRQIEIRYLGKG